MTITTQKICLFVQKFSKFDTSDCWFPEVNDFFCLNPEVQKLRFSYEFDATEIKWDKDRFILKTFKPNFNLQTGPKRIKMLSCLNIFAFFEWDYNWCRIEFYAQRYMLYHGTFHAYINIVQKSQFFSKFPNILGPFCGFFYI